MIDRAHAFISLLDELARARGRTTSAFRTVRQSRGLSEMESVVLSAVIGAARAPTVSQIGRSLGHPRQVIQRAADALYGRGLIAMRDNPDHKRARLLEATEAGAAIKAEADIHGLELAAALTDGLDGALLIETVRSLRTIREAIEANLKNHPQDGEEDE
jgi:DNA-binding MarR family transcriptional regulator